MAKKSERREGSSSFVQISYIGPPKDISFGEEEKIPFEFEGKTYNLRLDQRFYRFNGRKRIGFGNDEETAARFAKELHKEHPELKTRAVEQVILVECGKHR